MAAFPIHNSFIPKVVGGIIGACALAGIFAWRRRLQRREQKRCTPSPDTESHPQRDVAVFWDIENMQVPRDVDPACLGNAIQSAARQLSDPHSLEFVNAYIDTQQLNTEQANSLSQLGFSLIHSPIAKEAADKAIIVDLLIWLLQHAKNRRSTSTPCVVLITRDHDFEPMLYKLRNLENIHAVLITDVSRVKGHFLAAPNEYFDWMEIVEDAKEQQKSLGIIPGLTKREMSQEAAKRQSRTPSRNVGRRTVRRGPRRRSLGRRGVEGVDAIDDLENESDSEVLSSGAETRSSSDNKGRKAFRQRTERKSPVKSATTPARKYSSVKPLCPSRHDEVADFVLHVLKKYNGTLSTSAIFRLMKNPGTGGGYRLYNFAHERDSSGRHVLFSEIKKHKDRFELFKSKRGIWYAKLTPGDHKPLCPNQLDNVPDPEADESSLHNRAKRLARKWSFQFDPSAAVEESDNGASN